MAVKATAIGGFLRHCVNEGHMAEDFTDLLTRPHPWKRQPRILSREKVTELLQPDPKETPDSLCDQAVLELAYASGMRFSELKNLQLNKLSLEAEFITVIGKGNKERVVVVGESAVKAIQHYLEAGRPALISQEPKRQRADRKPRKRQTTDKVFLNHWGRPFGNTAFWKRIKQRAKARGIPQLTPHWLRHSFATTCTREGPTFVSFRIFWGMPRSEQPRYTPMSATTRREKIIGRYTRGQLDRSRETPSDL